MPGSAIEVRAAASDDELRAFERLAAQALLFPPALAQGFTDREGHDRFRLAFAGGRLAGGIGVQPIGQWFGGRPVPTAAVRAVAVAPEQRSRGVARALLGHAFDEMRAAGLWLSCLYPATQVVYRRAGYELGGARIAYRLPSHALPLRPGEATVRPVALDDPAPLVAPYRERARRTAGHLERNDWLWRRVLAPPGIGDSVGYLVEADGVEGYLLFHQARDAHTLRGTIRARELVANSGRAAQSLLAFLAGHRSIIEAVTFWGGPGEPLLCRLDNPAFTVEERWDWMLRLVDVAAALGARGYPVAARGEVHLEVEDDVLGWNRGRLVLAVAGGRAEVRPGGDGRVRADVRGLAPLYTGHLAPLELRAAGSIDGPEEDLAVLASLFAGPAPWMPDMF